MSRIRAKRTKAIKTARALRGGFSDDEDAGGDGGGVGGRAAPAIELLEMIPHGRPGQILSPLQARGRRDGGESDPTSDRWRPVDPLPYSFAAIFQSSEGDVRIFFFQCDDCGVIKGVFASLILEPPAFLLVPPPYFLDLNEPPAIERRLTTTSQAWTDSQTSERAQGLPIVSSVITR